MDTADRLTHQLVVSPRRSSRRKTTQRRAHRWPSQAPKSEAQAPQLDIPSRFLTPIWEAPLTQRMALSATAGQVDIAMVIDADADAHETVRRARVAGMPLATLNWRHFGRAPVIGLFYGACAALMAMSRRMRWGRRAAQRRM